MDKKQTRKWMYPTKKYDYLKEDTMLDDLALQVLVNRGIDTPEMIDKFLNDNLNHLHNTREMKDAEKGVQIIKEAVINKEQIVILGDYDCDGTVACAVPVSALRNIGAKVDYYTNNRFTQGYGLMKSSVDEILERYPDTKLIVTVDNGIMAFEGASYAKSLGLKLVITDHHEPGNSLPEADAIIDPKRTDETYPCKYLCGAGVIWKLMLLLYWELGEDLDYLYDKLDMVALATVGDIVPLLDENRIIVKEGLEKIKQEKSLVFKVLREVTGVTEINSHYTLGFVYVPMINAIGRMEGSVDLAIEMLISDDEDRIREIATYLKEVNDNRKELTISQQETGERLLDEKGIKEVVIVSDESFHEGIVGLVSGRLKESYNRPTIVLKKKDGILKGSARSISGLHLKEAFDKCSDLLLGYGGHEMACGLSLKEENLEAFENRIVEIAKSTFTEDDFVRKYHVDARLKTSEFTLDTVDVLKELEPFGNGFEKPLLMVEDFEVNKTFFMGEDKTHVKLIGENKLSLIIWREASKYKDRGEPKKLKALGYPEINVFNNNVNLQFTVDSDNFIPI